MRFSASRGKRYPRSCFQRLVDVGDEISEVFETDRQPDGARGDARLARLVRGEITAAHQLRRHDQRLGRAETRGEREQRELLAEAARRLTARLEIEAHDGAGLAHLLLHERRL